MAEETPVDFNLAEVSEAIADAIPDRNAILFRDRRYRYRDLRERTRAERSELAGHESGQDHLALYLYNGNEYIEGMLGAFKARAAPVNVNYRYVEEELVYLLRNCRARGIVYHAEFAPRLQAIRSELPDLEVLIQVADDSGHELLPGAVDYEEALAAASPERPDVPWSPDDLYILYTGGTTGMPKGVLWRQADILVAAMGGRRFDGSEYRSLEEIAEAARAGGQVRSLILPPLMHGAAQWGSFYMFHSGNTIVFPEDPRRLDPVDVFRTVERHRVVSMQIVGDAFARPLLDELAKGDYDLSSLKIIGSGGAPLSTRNKEEFLERIPGLTILDTIGSSETGAQASHPSSRETGVATGRFRPVAGAGVVSADLRRVLGPEDREMGWFSQTGRVPLGYLGDPEKTARTFPVIDGVRYSIPGDRARYTGSGEIEVLGRDSVCINTGGEKVFAEEVEHALKLHPAVFDAVVCGRPSERWGEEVVAVVQLRPGARVTEKELLETCSEHLARYKLPKAFVFRDRIVRSPSGKADYRWAREQVVGASGGAAGG